jgi:hypothetical protein
MQELEDVDYEYTNAASHNTWQAPTHNSYY